MILRWIQPEARDRKKSPAPTLSPASARISRVLAARKASSALALGDMGESEFNAILEEVCDTVMPRKPPAKRMYAAQSKNAEGSESHNEVPWATLFHKMGEETASSLALALEQLQEMALLYPNVAPAIAHVTDRLEHTRRVALIAQQFTQLRGEPPREPQLLSLRQVVSDAITMRARWLHRRKVKARLGLLDAQLLANPVALCSLIDELINWAGGLAQDIGFAVREATPDQPSAQLLVIAKVNTASIAPDQWQNVGWYLWHQLAGSLGAKAELQVTQEALSVTVEFATQASGADANPSLADSELHRQDTDMHSVIAGCRVLLLMGSAPLHAQVHHALSPLGLQISACASVSQAHALLGIDLTESNSPTLANWPQAVVFDGNLDQTELTHMRNLIQMHTAHHKMAFVEISEHVGSDFHVSHMGDASTAHVAAQAIAQSLAPALVFELCKVI